MGWLRRLRRSLQFRLWLTAVLPCCIIFLVAGVILRAIVRHRLLVAYADTGIPTGEIYDIALPGTYIITGALVGLVVATFLTYILMRRSVAYLHQVSHVAGELARGNYAVKVSLPRGASDVTTALVGSLNQLAESLERTERLRREMVANLAHEIRTPLTNLQGYLEALRDGVIVPNQEALNSVHEEVMRLVRLVGALHQLARADALRHQLPELQPTNIDRLVEQLLDVVRPHMEAKRIKLSVDLLAHGRRASVHADSVAQVLRNLLRNAAMYTPDDGEIRVQTAVVSDHYLFQCLNTGPGIPPEDLPLLFQRFFRSERGRQAGGGGVGLGLAIAKELVEAHRGNIGVESKAGWTTFWVELPLEQEQ